MQTAMVALHNVLRWVIIILLLASIIKSLNGWMNKKTFTTSDRKLFLFTLISAHLNFLVGLYLLFFGKYGIVGAGIPQGVNVMKDNFYRFFLIEHPTAMLIAIILITVGNSASKKAALDTLKFKKAFWFFFIAFVIILASVPWPFREIGRPWFPGM